MTEGLTFLSWNLNGETPVSDSQLEAQLDFIDDQCGDVDVLLFQAVRNESTGTKSWGKHLQSLLDLFENRFGECHVAHTGDWSQDLMESTIQPHADITGTHNRCNVTVSRWPVERRPLDLRNRGDRKPKQLDYYYSHFPEKMLVTEFDTSGDENVDAEKIECWNVGIINGANWGEEKVNMLETIYGRIYLQNEKLDHPVMLGGDFNAPKKETADREILPHGGSNYTNYPFYGTPYYLDEGKDGLVEYEFGERWRRAEQRIFVESLGEWDMKDAYLSAPAGGYEPSTEEYTHVIHNGTPSKKRLDHILVSSHFDIESCEIWNGRRHSLDGLNGDGRYKSDHAPVVADVYLTGAGS